MASAGGFQLLDAFELPRWVIAVECIVPILFAAGAYKNKKAMQV